MVTIAGVDRGLTVDAIKEMELGHLVDYVMEYNRMHDYKDPGSEPGKEKPKRRKATQADWDNFWG